ncbi:unnamed protein product [Larinioides sclopetarius]|uniref:DUF19 domain-containing protein n=1 Tax=Larinioides sclopetarius TaxID=280406 RepID=A0AAV2BL76_9ARAC
MLLYVFFVLGAWRGVIGSDNICTENEYPDCKMIDIGFPKTEEDINRICPILIENLDCLKNHFDKCGYEFGTTEDELQALQGVTEDVCREGSRMHLGVVQHIGCFNEVKQLDKQFCESYVRSKVSKMKNYLYDIEAERGYSDDYYDPELWLPFQCIRNSFEIACSISKTSERCGSDAKDIASEILTRANVAHIACSVSSEERIAELLALLELEMEEESLLRRIMWKE